MEKINKKRISFDHIPVVGLFVFAILFIVSCIDESIKPDNNEAKDKAEYELVIITNVGKEKPLIGDSVDSNWDPSLGIVWLGTDENNLPTGTLTIFIDTIITFSGIREAWISSANLSTSDTLTGTAEEINGKFYILMEGVGESGIQFLDSVVVGANYISGKIGRDDQGIQKGWLMKETTTDEIIQLFGTFTAIK